VYAKNQTDEAEHDERDGDEMDALIHLMLMAFTVVGQQLVDAAFGQGVF
jgi:hypothetical protein